MACASTASTAESLGLDRRDRDRMSREEGGRHVGAMADALHGIPEAMGCDELIELAHIVVAPLRIRPP